MKRLLLLVAAIATLGTAAQAQNDLLKNLRTNTTYNTFDAAKQTLQAGDTLQLLADYDQTSTFVVDSTTPAFTFDMNGHILNAASIPVPTQRGSKANAFFCLGDLSIMDGNHTSTHNTGNPMLDTIQGAIITGGQGYHYYDSEDQESLAGGALYVEGSVLTVDGVTFCGNNISSDEIDCFGGAIFADGLCHLSNCVFFNNSSSYSGGAFEHEGYDTLTVDHSEFYRNSAHLGGAISIYNNDDGIAIITNTNIHDNTASVQGAGMQIIYTDCILGEGTIVKHNIGSSEYGFPVGGIYCWREDETRNAQITLSGNVVIDSNYSEISGAMVEGNLCLSGDGAHYLPQISGLGPQSHIGVTTMVDDDVTMGRRFTQDGSANQVSNFFSDVEGYEVAYNEAGYLETRATSSAIEQTETPIECYAFTEGRNVVVAHAAGHSLALYDVMGHLLKHVDSANESEHFTVPTHGIYIVSIEGRSSLRMVVR